MVIKAIDFDYNTTAVSKEQYDLHLKLYKGYIDKVNVITNGLKTKGSPELSNSVYSKYRGLKKGETFSIDAVILHELYFQNMSNSGMQVGKNTNEIFSHFDGNYFGWINDFKACAKSARGWCVFCYEQRTESFRNILQDSHDDGVIIGSYPLIVLDMYEHAYFLDYGVNKEQYIQNFISAINWDIVEQRCNRLGIV